MILFRKMFPVSAEYCLCAFPGLCAPTRKQWWHRALSENVWPGVLWKRDWKSVADGIVHQSFDSEGKSMEGNKSYSWYLALLRTCFSGFSLRPSGKQVVVIELKQRHQFPVLSKKSWVSHQNVLFINSCVLCGFCGVVEG